MKAMFDGFKGELPREHWPKALIHPACRGVFIGGCVSGQKSFRAQAHAHIEGEHKGFVCVRAGRRLYDEDLCYHELAHLISESGHTKKFLRALKSLGAHREVFFMKRRYKGLRD